VQLSQIIFHERDEFGRIKERQESKLTEEERFRKRWSEWGLSEDAIDGKWGEFVELTLYRDALEREGVKPEDIERKAQAYERKLLERREWGLW
jgi:hypothetical protein